MMKYRFLAMAAVLTAFCINFIYTPVSASSDCIYLEYPRTIKIDTTEIQNAGLPLSIKVEKNSSPIYLNTVMQSEIQERYIKFELNEDVWDSDEIKVSLGGAIVMSAVKPIGINQVEKLELSVGDYIQLGSYKGKPIIWRCVCIDENGPLLLSDKILTFKAFDGAHDAGINGFWSDYGSNLWRDSNLSQWLNSAEGEVGWTNAPTQEKVYYNEYDNESGFLNNQNFTEDELGMIRLVWQKQIVSLADIELKAGGKQLFSFSRYPESMVQDFSGAYGFKSVDRMFVPDAGQIAGMYANKSVLGENYLLGIPTETALSDCALQIKQLFERNGYVDYMPYWLRTPVAYAEFPEFVSIMRENGLLDIEAAYHGGIGVRPAFYLDSDYCVTAGGDGTADSPYTLSYIRQPASDRLRLTADLYGKQLYVEIEGGEPSDLSGKIVAGFYDINDRLVELITVNVSSIYQQYELTGPDESAYRFAKVYWWNSLDTMMPISDCLELVNN